VAIEVAPAKAAQAAAEASCASSTGGDDPTATRWQRESIAQTPRCDGFIYSVL